MRLLLLVLVLANALYFSWSQGLLSSYGFAPHSDAEPQRLARQIRPEAVRVLPASVAESPASAASAASSLPRPVQCLQAGIFDEAQAERLRVVLRTEWAADRWSLDPAVQAAQWIIYLGPYATTAALTKKRAELVARKLEPRELDDPALEPGLSLGSFETEGDARAQLEEFAKRGVRTARVLQSRPELKGLQLRLLVGLSEPEQARLAPLQAVLAGKPLVPCS